MALFRASTNSSTGDDSSFGSRFLYVNVAPSIGMNPESQDWRQSQNPEWSRAEPPRTALPNAQRLDLPEVIDVVAGVVVRDVADRFAAAFGVDAVHLPFVGAQPSEEVEVRFPQGPKQLDRLRHVARVVPSRARPDVLVERLNRRPGSRKDEAYS